ncbi:MAG: hypothetical protein QM804_14335 [Propionicimonas sp.]
MSKVVIVGAGRLGKGYFGEVFEAAGWGVTYLDKDPRVIDALRDGGEIRVTVLTTDSEIERRLTGFSSALVNDHAAVAEVLSGADVVMLPLYPQDFAEAAADLAPALAEVARNRPDHRMSFICATNKNHIIGQIQRGFVDALPDEPTRAWFMENVVVRDSIVRRSTDAATSWSTDLVTTAVAPLLIQGPLHHDVSGVPWMEVRDNIEVLKDVKVLTINGPHATTAYAGAALGYATIPAASADPGIAELVARVKSAIDTAVLMEYPVTREELHDLEYLPKSKRELEDAISRVAFDPIRKLGRHDRLVGAALLCRKHGVDDDAVVEAIAYALAYSDPEDAASQRLAALRHRVGPRAALAEVAGLPVDDPLVVAAADRFEQLASAGTIRA